MYLIDSVTGQSELAVAVVNEYYYIKTYEILVVYLKVIFPSFFITKGWANCLRS